MLEQRHWDLIGLGLVAFAAFFACVFYLGWAGGEVGEILADAMLFMFGGVGYGAPIVLFAAGALIVIRPMIPAVHPFKTGTLCLAGALMLGLAAGSLGLGPGDTPRDGFLDASYLEHHGGLVGESLFWASAKLFSTAGSHILFMFLLLAGVLLLTGASVAGIVTATREAAVTTTERVRRTTGTVRVPYEPLPPMTPPEPEDREPVVRATHVEVPAPDEDEFQDFEPEYEDTEPEAEPEPELEPEEADAEVELTPMGNRRSPVTESDDIDYRMPKLSFLKRSTG
ncbi:MAG TPA: DNA translocase FtsK 4TM domain-containing protein, partial [Thermoleophilaceae bacterium]|nr:DNA translocase FtsK 4TM domain-containing protein [Thermoleophilaceae bacterium]